MLKEIKVSLKKYKNPKANNGINVAPTLVIFVLAVRIFRGARHACVPAMTHFLWIC
jgi:hypothetical protein